MKEDCFYQLFGDTRWHRGVLRHWFYQQVENANMVDVPVVYGLVEDNEDGNLRIINVDHIRFQQP